MQVMISIVFPAYNEEGNVEELHRRIVAACQKLREPFEVVAVDNASTDETLKRLETLSPIRIISLANNLGQTAALDAAIHAARGDVVAILDADLQNDPADIPAMVEKVRSGVCDAAVGWRKERRDTVGRRMITSFSNWLARRIVGLPLHDYACAPKVFTTEFPRDTRLYGEMHVFLAAILAARGARITEVPVKHHERTHGLSKHTFIKGAKDIADLMTIKFILGTSRPLLIFLSFALASWGIGGSATVLSIILKVGGIRNFAQTPLPVVASFFITAGLIFLMMGFLAEFMLRTYYEARQTTPYVIRKIVER
jgi:glycosyltransferase involved in cell wall biosynthesis